MNALDQHDWRPDPQLLAAYFDGEMEGRDDVADLRGRLEAWLQQHPEVRAQWAELQALRRLWIVTTPREPGNAAWNQVLERIDIEGRRPASPGGRHYRRSIGAIAASVALLVGLGYAVMRYASGPPLNNKVVAKAPIEDDEIFPVATATEVVVTYIEGADTRAIAVGQLPVHGPLELAEIGDVHIIAIRSDADPRMLPHMQQDGPNRPMIWMPLQTD